MSASDPVVIIGAARTPMGAFLGELKDISAPQLGARAIKATASRSQLPVEKLDDVIMGCVLPAGLGQAPARQAALGAGLLNATACVTVNKMCGSGMKAIMFAHDALCAGSSRVVIAGGMESMSNAPYLLDRARSGYRMGHGKLLDHMFIDGLEDAYEKSRLMGCFAEDCASDYQLTREMQDDYAAESLSRARRAIAEGAFQEEIVAVISGGKVGREIGADENPCRSRDVDISKLKPAFRADGSITAANSSSISDGAAAVALTTLTETERMAIQPSAKIVGHATYAGPPNKFPIAPIAAIKKLMDRTGWKLKDVDLFEINEAFAIVTMVAMRELGIPHEKLNVHGGACALGHPIGASGARIIVTLLAALRRYNLHRGVAALCIGGGEATAIAIERIS